MHMRRHIGIFIIGSVAVATLNAGSVQIQIGSGTNGVNGLTAGTVTQGVVGATGTLGEAAYIGNLPPGGTALTYTSGVPVGGYPNGETSGGQALTVNDGGTNVTFAMIDDSAHPTANMWDTSNTTTGTVGTPIVTTDTIAMGGLGVFGVSNVWTMLNDQYGSLTYNSGQTTQVTFNFTTLTGGFVAPLTFTLTNGVEIRGAVNCTAGTGLSACQAFAYQNGLDTTNDYSTTGALNPSSGPNVSAFNVWTGTYNDTVSGGSYGNTSGNVYLDGQNFNLGSGYANDYLTSVQITDADAGSRQSRDILSAITVEGSTLPPSGVPEPSTWLLFATGLGVLGFVRLRRKSAC